MLVESKVTTLYINAIEVGSHMNGEPAAFQLSRQPIAGSVNPNDVMGKFYDTHNEDSEDGLYPTRSTPSELVGELVGNTVWMVKCFVHDKWMFMEKHCFATKQLAQEWLDRAKRERDADEDGEDAIYQNCAFDDLGDEMVYSQNWHIVLEEVELEKIGWSEWTND